MADATVGQQESRSWFSVSPVTRRRFANFRKNRRGWWSFWIFLVLFVVSLFADFIANDRPIVVQYDGRFFFPVVEEVAETEYGGFFETAADYTDPAVVDLIEEKGWMIWPPIRYRYDTPSTDLPGPAPTPPDSNHWLGTDDEARDLAARLIYGFRISVLFGLALTIATSVIGIFVGLVQGFFGGWTDLAGQRLIEVWNGLPVLYLLIILASIVQPNF